MGRERRGGCLQPILVWIASALSLWATAFVVPGFTIEGFFPRALVAALVLGVLNALVRPLIVLLTLPVTILTLGLFLLVVNAMMIGLAAWLLDGFDIDGPLPAIAGALVLAVVNGLVTWILEPQRPRRRDVVDM